MRIAVLIAATLTTGIIAGLFFTFSVVVMPALGQTTAPVLVEVMQRINRVILNGWFGLCFGGALVFTALATVLYALDGPAGVLVPVAIALVLYAAQLAVTFGRNIPLNNALDTAGPTDPERTRAAFEVRWVRLNHVRTVLCSGSFGALCWALVQA